MVWKKEYLDLVLVPTGLLIMFCYHLFLLYRCLRHPETTVIGNENHCRKAWVERMLQVEAKDRGLSLTVISGTITAANFLASTSLALSSLIGAWIGSSSHNIFMSSITYGDTSPAIISIKYISILACFLLALASFLQCIRNFVHANFLISMPDNDIPLAHVEKAVISGGLFWTLGLDSNSTPLHQFQPAKSHNVLRKIGEENSRIERVIEQQHERSHMDGSRAQG
ncbi:uncharacterized protein LOC110774465 isoform X2 [Prunus avium]|uniref:Uncharacterized protein LOC110774465 isoform X2 n=1 Tax=Prunus avium TaxID=42229 RepID=A0A6P5U5W1_PRUAV|nr:uncharacterized protein LOC110774465 isoform X2 [Prunus avium]